MTAASTAPSLAAERRTIVGRQVKALRKQGKVPAVVYGHNKDSVALTLDQKTFAKLFDEAGSSTLVALSIDGAAPVKVLIHEVDMDPIRREPVHADLYIVNLKEKLRTEVSLVMEGVADAVDILAGTLIHVKDAVEIECLPDDLIPEIKVDISKLKTFEDTITVADLVVPSTVTIIDEPEQTLISVAEPRSEEEMAALDEAPVAEVETEFGTDSGTDATPEGEEGEAKAE